MKTTLFGGSRQRRQSSLRSSFVWTLGTITGCMLAVACGSARQPVDDSIAGDTSAGGSASDAGASNGGANEAGAPSTAPSRRICDGSIGIRLVFTYAANRGRLISFTSVLADLGSDFLYVDGTCRYWVQEPSLSQDNFQPWRPYREGTLSAEQEELLHDTIGYDDFAVGPAASACNEEPSIDQSIPQLWDGQSVHRCLGMLRLPEDWPLRSMLYSQAATFVGPIRIQVGLQDIPDNQAYEWPLLESPENYLVEFQSADSHRIDDLAKADALRRVRDRVLEDAARGPTEFQRLGLILVKPPGFMPENPNATFVMSLRDDPPFTNDQGLWAPP